jgi:hypothetical protein
MDESSWFAATVAAVVLIVLGFCLGRCGIETEKPAPGCVQADGGTR